MEALLAQAVALGVSEAHARRVLRALADTDEALRLLSDDPERFANALFDTFDSPPRAAAAAAGGGAAGGDGAIDLTADSDEEPAKQQPPAGAAARKRPREEQAPPAAAPPAALQPPLPPAADANNLMALLAAERHARHGRPPPPPPPPPPLAELKLLTYNVWFMEDVALEARMRGIGADITAEQPHILCLQEVTPNIEALFRAAPWWASYDASPAPSRSPYYTLLLLRKPLLAGAGVERVPFQGSVMGRDLLVGGVACGGGVNLLAGTSHLESYLGPGQTSSSERVAQMREALTALARTGCANLVFAGDTNWDDATDGDLSKLLAALPGGAAAPWRDAWATLRPREAGHTYDSVANAMLVGSLKKRLDRVVFRLRDYEPAAIRMLGTAPLPGVTYEKTFRNGGSKTLPVCNSDHFGLLFTMRRVEKQGGVAA